MSGVRLLGRVGVMEVRHLAEVVAEEVVADARARKDIAAPILATGVTILWGEGRASPN